MEQKNGKMLFGTKFKNTTTLTGYRRNETSAVELQLQLEKNYFPSKTSTANLYLEAKEPI